MRHGMCLRIFRTKSENGRAVQWIMGNDELKQLILEVA
jgi:hypothetical protein